MVVYELSCPGCKHVMRCNFARLGAVVDCEGCRRRFVVNADLIKRQVNASGAEALARLYAEFASGAADASAPPPAPAGSASSALPRSNPPPTAAQPRVAQPVQAPPPAPAPVAAKVEAVQSAGPPSLATPAPAAVAAPVAATPPPVDPPAPAGRRDWRLLKYVLMGGAVVLMMVAVALVAYHLGTRTADRGQTDAQIEPKLTRD